MVAAQPAVAGTTGTVCALSENFQSVLRYDGSGTRWTEIDPAPAGGIYGGGAGLLVTGDNGDVYRYRGTPGSWQRIGGPGAQFVVTDETIYGLSPDNSGVWRYNNSGTSWTNIGGFATYLVGGSDTLLADVSHVYNIVYRYTDSPGDWELIDDTPFTFPSYAIRGNTIYQSIYRFADPSEIRVYRGAGRWDDVSPPFGPGSIQMYAGGYGLFAIEPPTGNIWRHVSGTSWEVVGGPGYEFAVSDTRLYGVGPVNRRVYRYNGSGTSWNRISDFPVERIVPCP